MKIEYITIDAGQRFDAVMPEIPTNSIINKTVTGCGATYAEINAPRHSVIIEPNVPVIEGKMKKHPQILGVFEGVTTEDIIDFLNTNYNDGYLKIMTTPESFPKVRSAMVQTHTDMHGEWFMLFDECERTIQDAGYRGSITLPMDDFILCAQFESFLQPLIVLMEIPIDTAFALLALWVFGHTLNLMSAIGIIVTCGIVVNDSILKMDAINELRKAGMPLVEAIHTAGRRRLRAIIMTSLTTVFAMVPLLFTSDMGSEMQKPLSIAMIGSMVVGTLVSLFIIPLIYWFIYRKHDKNEVH